MPDHIRRSARDERPRNSGAVMIAVTASVAAIIAGVVFLSTHAGNGGQAAQQEEVAATEDAASSDAKTNDKDQKTSGDAKDEESKDSESKDKDKDESKSEDESANDKKDDESTSNSGDSARMGNSYNADANEVEGSSDAQDGSDSNSGSTDASGSGSSSSSSSADSSSSSSDAGTGSASSSSNSAPRSAAYTSADGWISAEACATEVAEVGTITASEIPFDDDVPMVGLDTASYPYEHFGNYVEIEYNGVTVTAQVVDCGAYNGGTSGIVINPAVFYEFGVNSVYDWGRREVSYRFV